MSDQYDMTVLEECSMVYAASCINCGEIVERDDMLFCMDKESCKFVGPYCDCIIQPKEEV